MIKLALPLHPDWTGGLDPIAYLDKVAGFGVNAVEVQLPPTLTSEALHPWLALTQTALDRAYALSLHAPLPADHPVWAPLLHWLRQAAGSTALTLIVHGCARRRWHPSLIAETIAWLRRLLDRLPATATVAVELGWNPGARPGGPLRRAAQRWRRSQPQRPSGVGSGMGAAAVSATPPAGAEQRFDPQLPQPTCWPCPPRNGFRATGSRATTLGIVEQIDHPRCTIAWDLAHDWLGGSLGGVPAWHSIPPLPFLQRVGYVRVHDVDAGGADHWPLVLGTVPYTSQLRALVRHGFDGTVCLAARYPPAIQAFGDRWHLLDRSLDVLRQALRLH